MKSNTGAIIGTIGFGLAAQAQTIFNVDDSAIYISSASTNVGIGTNNPDSELDVSSNNVDLLTVNPSSISFFSNSAIFSQGPFPGNVSLTGNLNQNLDSSFNQFGCNPNESLCVGDGDSTEMYYVHDHSGSSFFTDISSVSVTWLINYDNDPAAYPISGQGAGESLISLWALDSNNPGLGVVALNISTHSVSIGGAVPLNLGAAANSFGSLAEESPNSWLNIMPAYSYADQDAFDVSSATNTLGDAFRIAYNPGVVQSQGIANGMQVGIANPDPSGLFEVGLGTITASANGNVGVDQSNPQYPLDVSGPTRINGVLNYGAQSQSQLQALACSTYPGTPCTAYDAASDDIVTSTGPAAGQWRNTRTGGGP